MNIAKQHHGFNKKVMVLAVLAAFNPAYGAEGDDIAQLTKPDSSASIGMSYIGADSKERSIFGQYNGMRHGSYYGQLDIDAVKRDDATGTWTILTGHNLGLNDRDLLFSQQKQGDWKYYAEYSQLSRYYPRTINTGMQGAGSTTPTVNLLTAPGTGNDLELKTNRESVGLGMEKWLTPSLQFEVNAKNEDKDGSRLFGRGFACTSGAAPLPTNSSQVGCAAGTQYALLMLPEPIKSTTRQIEAKLNFSGNKLLLTGGYYGSFFTNAYGNLTPNVPGTLNNPFGVPTALNTPAGFAQINGLQGILQLPMALPPDNQAHQFYVDGNYAITPTTRSTFKLAYTHATQNDNFLGNGLTGAPGGRTDLGGVVDTTLAQLGLTMRPVPKLSVLANVRYENKKDKTPIALYNVEGDPAVSTNYFTNGHNSHEKYNAKLEGSYQLPANNRATLGADYEQVEYTTPVSTTEIAGISAIRQELRELGFRAELRHSMSETLNGAVSYGTSRRDGASNWYNLCTSAGCVAQGLTSYGVTYSDSIIYQRTGIFPMMFENRNRDKVKLSADWAATERLSLQFMVEDAKDNYSAPTTKGLRDFGYLLYSIDATMILSDKWKLTGYWSQNDQELHVAHSSGYDMTMRTLNTTLGFGVVGKPSGRLEVGTDLSYLNDSTRYNQDLDPLTSPANVTFLNQSGGLPEVAYDEFRLRLFGKYALEKNADLRVDLVHFRARMDEWTWGYGGVPFAYSDNTTVSFDTKQHVTFLGATYIYKWR